MPSAAGFFSLRARPSSLREGAVGLLAGCERVGRKFSRLLPPPPAQLLLTRSFGRLLTPRLAQWAAELGARRTKLWGPLRTSGRRLPASATSPKNHPSFGSGLAFSTLAFPWSYSLIIFFFSFYFFSRTRRTLSRRGADVTSRAPVPGRRKKKHKKKPTKNAG